MKVPGSWACSAFSERGFPRKTMPKSFTKAASATPPASASAGAANPARSASPGPEKARRRPR